MAESFMRKGGVEQRIEDVPGFPSAEASTVWSLATCEHHGDTASCTFKFPGRHMVMVSYDSGPEISVGIGNESLTGIHKIVVDQDEQQIELHAERQITMVDSTGKILTPTT